MALDIGKSLRIRCSDAYALQSQGTIIRDKGENFRISIKSDPLWVSKFKPIRMATVTRIEA